MESYNIWPFVSAYFYSVYFSQGSPIYSIYQDLIPFPGWAFFYHWKDILHLVIHSSAEGHPHFHLLTSVNGAALFGFFLCKMGILKAPWPGCLKGCCETKWEHIRNTSWAVSPLHMPCGGAGSGILWLRYWAGLPILALAFPPCQLVIQCQLQVWERPTPHSWI